MKTVIKIYRKHGANNKVVTVQLGRQFKSKDQNHDKKHP